MNAVNTVSTKPYLIRAIYEWCVDQGFSPHIASLVDRHVQVPPGYARDGQIVLDISPEATNNLVIGNEDITFQARFSGAVHALMIPMSHVLAVYAGENGHGMAFEAEVPADDASDEPDADSSNQGSDAAKNTKSSSADTAAARRSHLKIIK